MITIAISSNTYMFFSQENPEELKKFAVEPSVWNDERGPFSVLKAMNPSRMEFFVKALEEIKFEKLPENTRILDIGCGCGFFSESLARKGYKVWACDPSPESREAALERSNRTNLQFHVISPNELQYDCKKFDILSAMEVIEHIDNHNVLSQWFSLLNPGGVFIAATISKTFMARLQAIFLAEKIFKIVPKGTHSFEKFISPYDLTILCQKSNIEVFKTSGVRLNIFNKTWRLSDNHSINYIIAGRKLSPMKLFSH